MSKHVNPRAVREREATALREELAQPQVADIEQEQPEPEQQKHEKNGARIQVNFKIGQQREQKLLTLEYQYNIQKGTHIGRNDIIRYLIDKVTLEELLTVDLREYKK